MQEQPQTPEVAASPVPPPPAPPSSQPLVPSLPVFVDHAIQPSKELIKPKAILGRPLERPTEVGAAGAGAGGGSGPAAAAAAADECPGSGARGVGVKNHRCQRIRASREAGSRFAMEGLDDKLILNVGGMRHETYISTVRAFPGTRLYKLTEPPPPGTPAAQGPPVREFFFDRNPELFSYVLGYYRTRQLHCPADVCRDVLEEELAYWGLAEAPLAPCCWLKLGGRETRTQDFLSWEACENAHVDERLLLNPIENQGLRNAWKPWLWMLLDQPRSSLGAKCLSLISALFAVCALVIFFQETEVQLDYFSANFTPVGHGVGAGGNQQQPQQQQQQQNNGLVYRRAPHLLYLELLCALWFGTELFARAISCPDKVRFLCSPLNLADIFCLFPVLVELVVGDKAERQPRLSLTLGAIRSLYVLKLVRLLGFLEKSLALRVLVHTLHSSWKEVCAFILIWVAEILFFGSLFLYGELLGMSTPSQGELHFGDIFTCLWWTVITLTTVGYGDVYPLSALGQLTAAVTATVGMCTGVLLVPVLLVRFQRYYAVALARQKLRPSGL
ncbi:potassium voltage-gated channel subfamily C member 1-like [Dipodomys spectabilis]|uniref:potassium voltage-gated channel subfamily C member 1-like n=1 Tax=Dipodomys spectabilis TaxID=105255 RepID=UPI001C53CDDE|nr:potassium voltage-gated channel subfamily C member 1-like [Dipodomys spectabilis]XP_042522835.1 potassium voltage-gated channel subfamily C member 1-like [Dipodomys spectabilis]